MLGQPAQQAGGEPGRELVQQPHPVVGLERGEQFGHLAALEIVQQLVLQGGIQALEHLDRLALGQQAEHHCALAVLEPSAEVEDLGEIEGAELAGERDEVVVGEGLAEGLVGDVDLDVGGREGHGTLVPGQAAAPCRDRPRTRRESSRLIRG